MTAAPLTADRRRRLHRRSLHLAYATTAYNLVEGIVAVAAGAAASSIALLGFGLDSFIEVSSALVVIWQFRSRLPEARERLALRLIAVSFFALAAWVGVGAVRALLGVAEAQPSPVGIGIAAVSVVVMPLLVWAKRRTGRELGSATVLADSVQTMLCTYLSAIVLVGLLVNATLGWSWADPVAALVVAAVAVREGAQAWRGEQCDDCAVPAVTVPDGAGGGCGCGPDCVDRCCAGTATTG
ncbi:cation transporter [Micromonospora echinofusca]|uniref:Cation transporter n=1 Tax=Micromonospora echinofusca TaxID=47858 RepID=A0ABS3VK27_MICEH|nr:cation transporter [Micromonospora echinofusca]MBO4204821.1 cation transporter [Micromonospora echinofusca]